MNIRSVNNKVIITYHDVNQNIAEETLWIESIDNTKYQVKNVPFFAPNIAYNDIITVEKEEDNCLYFDEVIETSEHSTVQIIFFEREGIEQTIKEIELLGCSWEGMHNQQLLAIDVPSEVNYKKVRDYLDKQFGNKILDYKEACLSETHLSNL